MRQRRFPWIPTIHLALGGAKLGAAQGPSGAIFYGLGPGCPDGYGGPTLGGAFVPGSCGSGALAFSSSFCCENVLGRFLVFGWSGSGIDLSAISPGCFLFPSPDAVVVPAAGCAFQPGGGCGGMNCTQCGLAGPSGVVAPYLVPVPCFPGLVGFSFAVQFGVVRDPSPPWSFPTLSLSGALGITLT